MTRPRTSDPSGLPLWIDGPGTFPAEVVGESHYQDALEWVCGGRTVQSAEFHADAVLVCEDDNPHDPAAVRVDIRGRTVGYLSRGLAPHFRRYLKDLGRPRAPAACRAVVRGGWDRGGGDRGHFGVSLDLPPLGRPGRRPGRRDPGADFAFDDGDEPRGSRSRRRKGGWPWVLAGVAVAALLGCCGLVAVGGLFTKRAADQGAGRPNGAGGQGGTPPGRLARAVEVLAVRLDPAKDPNGFDTKAVCVEWRNVGSDPVHAVRATIRVYARDGRLLDVLKGQEVFTVGGITPEVPPGRVYQPAPGAGVVLNPNIARLAEGGRAEAEVEQVTGPPGPLP